MTLTTSIITGRVPLPTDEPVIRGVVTFSLVGYDTQGDNALPSGVDATFDLTEAGELPAGAKLWRNTSGSRGTVYRMIANWVEPSNVRLVKSYSFGFVQVGGDAEYTIADLLNSAPPDAVPKTWWSSITQAQYDGIMEAAQSVEDALTGAPWQVIGSGPAAGKAVARDLTFSSVVDLNKWTETHSNLILAGYPYALGEPPNESKATPISASVASEAYNLVIRDGGRGIVVPSPVRLDHATNKDYVDTILSPILGNLSALYSMNYPVGVANPPTASPQNNTAMLGGAEARHTNPGSNQGGGIAFGISAKINGLHHVAFGPLIEIGPRNGSDVYDVTMTGTSHSVAVGGAAQVSVNNGTALGARAKVKHTNSVALGADAETDAIDTVSVGNATKKRRITDVADPAGAQDAATKAYVDRALSPAQRAAITALTPIANPATATAEQVATLLNSLIAALKA